jgi:hypothetical protein
MQQNESGMKGPGPHIASLDLGSESLRVALEDRLYCRLANLLELLVVAAGQAVTVVAVTPAGEALAVQLEAARVLTVAVLFATGRPAAASTPRTAGRTPATTKAQSWPPCVCLCECAGVCGFCRAM